MIKSFTINNIATFDANGVAFDNLKQINFVYGTNGSGKTTISNLLKNSNPNCSVSWIADNPLDIYVYNKNFKNKNILANSFSGIFTLGEKNLETEKLIRETKEAIDNFLELKVRYQNDLQKKRDELKKLISNKTDDIWKNSEVRNNTLLIPALKGFRGDKTEFFNKNLTEINNSSELLSLEELETKATSIFSTNPKTCNSIESIPIDLLQNTETHSLWFERVIGKNDVDIADLINHMGISSDWVNTGIKYLQSDSNTCPFCQKNTINEEFRKSLENYFDTSYTQKKDKLISLQSTYKYDSSRLTAIVRQVIDFHTSPQLYDFDLNLFEQIAKNLNLKIDYNKQIMKDKIEEPSQIIELKDTFVEINQLNEIVSRSNQLIREHNTLIRDLSVSKQEIISQIWNYVIQKNKNILDQYLKSKNGIDSAITSMTRSISNIVKNIEENESKVVSLNKTQTNTQTTVDEINATLTAFGFNGFSIQPVDNNKYQLHRKDGSKANETLSEGEISFITFLYFYHLCKGGTSEETISSNRVIVIDDPISSLDSNILFVISSLVKNIVYNIKNAKEYQVKQLIILTHNIYFHKEASFVSGKTQEDSKVHFWLLRKSNDITSVKSHGTKNPILSSYELLWRELEEVQISSISLQNSMRRIIENYFKILGGIGDDDILAKFENPQEKMICRSLICWVNDGSHCIPDDLYIDGQYASSDEYRQVFRAIFENSGHLAHYEMMMRDRDIVNS